MEIFTILKRDNPDQICARDLRAGDVIPGPFKDKATVTVKSVTTMDGRNGEEPQLIGGNGMSTAMALKVEFHDHETVYAHPGCVVITR